jgi:hypothetical protein
MVLTLKEAVEKEQDRIEKVIQKELDNDVDNGIIVPANWTIFYRKALKGK